MSVQHSIELYGPQGGTRLGYLNRFSYLQYARKVNDVGSLTLRIDAKYVPLQAFDYSQRILRDLRIGVFRGVDNGIMKLDTDTVWFVRRARRTRIQNSTMLEITAVDAMHLLKRRIIAAAAGTSDSRKTGPLDDVMKAFVREACGSLANVVRQFPGFAVQIDLGQATTDSKASAWQNLLLTLQEIADSAAQQSTPTYLYFDVVAPTTDSLEFRTYIGQRGLDRRTQRPIGADYGNLANEVADYDTSDEITYVYAGGQGEGMDRVISEIDDPRSELGPYNRIEQFVDCRNIDVIDTMALAQESRATVRAGRPRFVFEGELVDVPSWRYGVDFGFGDQVRVQSDVDSFDCRIDALQVTIDQNGEEIDAKLRYSDAMQDSGDVGGSG